MKQPLVSVVIPNFNRGHLIEAVIDSIETQTYRQFEIIVVDDHSTDDSMEKLQSLKTRIPHLTVYQLPANQGANACRNKGVELAQGTYIAFLDSDDYFLPEKLERQVNTFAQFPQLGFVVTGFGAKNFTSLPEGFIPLKETIKQNNLGGFSTLMIKKEVFQQVGGLDEDLLSCQDWDLFLKVLQISTGYKIAEDLVLYETQTDSISKNSTKVVQGYQIVAKRAKAINQNVHAFPANELAAFQEYYLAMRYFGLQDMTNTRHHLWNSLRLQVKPIPLLYWLFAGFGYSALKKLLHLRDQFKKK